MKSVRDAKKDKGDVLSESSNEEISIAPLQRSLRQASRAANKDRANTIDSKNKRVIEAEASKRYKEFEDTQKSLREEHKQTEPDDVFKIEDKTDQGTVFGG